MIKIIDYLKRNHKGQGLTEYVLILAFIAGVAFMMFGGEGSLKGTVVSTFDKTVELLASINQEKSHLYTDGLASWGKITSEALANEDNDARLLADAEGLSNLASLFLGKTKDEIAEIFPTYRFSHLQNSGESEVVLMYHKETKTNTPTKLEYRNNTRYDRGTDWLQGTGLDRSYNDNYGWNYGDRYFFSNEMDTHSEKNIRLSLTYGSDGTVSSARAWAESGGNVVSDRLDVTVTK